MNKFNLPGLKDMVSAFARLDPELVDPRIIVGSLRGILEEVVNSFVEYYERPYLRDDLRSKIMLLHTKGYFTDDITRKAHNVRRVCNFGVHGGSEAVTACETREAIQNLMEILEYYEQY